MAEDIRTRAALAMRMAGSGAWLSAQGGGSFRQFAYASGQAIPQPDLDGDIVDTRGSGDAFTNRSDAARVPGESLARALRMLIEARTATCAPAGPLPLRQTRSARV